jgi:EAL domain-containing protein (putative c-di-GMP-specific phosphodiesterase class I)
LEIACVERALREAAALPADALLFLNGHPAAIGDSAYPAAVLAAAARSGISARRLVVELTEQQPIHHVDALVASIDTLRLHGVRFALDDVGSAYSHLPLIDRIRPSFLKISQQFGTSFEADETRTKVVRTLVTLGRDFHCDVILEGVEDAVTATAARELGIRLAQGYFFARPADAETFGGRRISEVA